MRRLCIGLFLAVALPAFAQTPPLRDAERERLDRFEEAAGRGLLTAFSEGMTGEIAALTGALSGRARTPSPEGDWSCRMIRMGELTPLVVFDRFTCRIGRISATEWQFDKLDGSERMTGIIAIEDGRALYRGVGFSGDGPEMTYAELPERQDMLDLGRAIPQVAVFEQTGGGAARLMFPYPFLEGTFDVLELTR
ncbi:uncharacterized protein DUF4893 [Palleronia aestuarii]|uniref:Uncharacterized protein DUF4893 n=1 Tax=Palleronia aestuarii TaxID=568105 RepID=A0A2W7NDM2_9RHOB|nr:DUF4893 domain-containing protein [Palleronia aestuarii]PZX18258.1 uncharacterized protein DUF4893 [Palleronia aestuarii]